MRPEIWPLRQPDRADPWDAPAEQAALGAHQRREHVVAEALAQHRAQVAEPVDQPVTQSRLCAPVFAREQGIFGPREARPPARLDEPDEGLVDLALDRLEARDVVGVLRQGGT